MHIKNRMLKLSIYGLFFYFSPNLYATTKFEPVHYQDISNWNCGDQLFSYKALRISCHTILKNGRYSSDWMNSCQAILDIPANTNRRARKILEQNFTPYKVISDNKDQGLFTGYYAPEVNGSLHKTGYYNVPLYKTPKDLIIKRTTNGLIYRRIEHGKLVPYYTRKQISDDKRVHIKDVIAWVHTRTDRSFLQIQGSGRINLQNGHTLLIGYASQNGRPYRPIGRYFLEKKLIPRKKISMQSIKKWLKENPNQADKVLNYDPSFVFFRQLNHKNPLGGQGVPLTPAYSLAIDHTIYKYGTPVWLSTTYPVQNKKPQALNRLMIAQDTGGAIKGPIRGDVYWGSGKLATYTAGQMKNKGKIYILLPKTLDDKNK